MPISWPLGYKIFTLTHQFYSGCIFTVHLLHSVAHCQHVGFQSQRLQDQIMESRVGRKKCQVMLSYSKGPTRWRQTSLIQRDSPSPSHRGHHSPALRGGAIGGPYNSSSCLNLPAQLHLSNKEPSGTNCPIKITFDIMFLQVNYMLP